MMAKIWKQPKYSWKDKWIKNIWHIYTTEYYSAIKNNNNNVICDNIHGPRGYYAARQRQTITI